MTQIIDYCGKAIALKKDIEINFLTLGEYLYYIKENQLYEPNWSSFEEFLFDLKLSSNTSNKLIQIYKKFILSYGFTSQEVIDAGGYSLLADVLPMISSRKSAEKWLNLTTVLTRQDLRKEIKEAKTGIQMKDCKHANTYKVEICRDCGERWQII